MRLRLFATVALLLGCTAGVAAQTAPAGVVEYYHVDALGSVRAVTSATGAVVRTHHYHPFGEGVESGADPMRFTGKPRDAETGWIISGRGTTRRGLPALRRSIPC